MDIYEVSYLIVPTITEEKVTDEVTAIRGVIEGAGATIITEEFPQSIPLAYTMERTIETKKHKFNEGYFGWIKFELPVASLSNITKALDTRPTIIRNLVIKTVRESTLYTPKVAGVAAKAADVASEVAAPDTEKKMAGNEIDKSIDALVIS